MGLGGFGWGFRNFRRIFGVRSGGGVRSGRAGLWFGGVESGNLIRGFGWGGSFDRRG